MLPATLEVKPQDIAHWSAAARFLWAFAVYRWRVRHGVTEISHAY